MEINKCKVINNNIIIKTRIIKDNLKNIIKKTIIIIKITINNIIIITTRIWFNKMMNNLLITKINSFELWNYFHLKICAFINDKSYI